MVSAKTYLAERHQIRSIAQAAMLRRVREAQILALSKHVARRSDSSDRALLEYYARNPQEAPEPLCWSLQFHARGDVVMEDGSIVLLDDLLTEHGVESDLPFVEDMPQAVTFAWEKLVPRRLTARSAY